MVVINEDDKEVKVVAPAIWVTDGGQSLYWPTFLNAICKLWTVACLLIIQANGGKFLYFG